MKIHTQEKILATAVDQFNEFGTAKVTTNQIAKAAGISSGNLYYHFENKAHIIREIYERMIENWSLVYEREEKGLTSIGGLEEFICANFELLWHYRFFYREMVVLIHADELLYKRHIEITKTRFKKQSNILEKFVREGVLKLPRQDIQLEELLTLAWIVANNYLTYLETMGLNVQKKDFEAGTNMVMKIFYPYLVNQELS